MLFRSTGVTYSHDTEIFGKQLELLKELLPKARLVAVLSNPGASPTLPLTIGKIEAAARSLDLRLRLLEARTPQEFDAVFAEMVKARVDALLLTGDTIFFVHRLRLAELAAKSRLPAMSTQTQWVEAGGLMRRVVVLPQPLGPSSVVSVPGAISKLTSRTASGAAGESP